MLVNLTGGFQSESERLAMELASAEVLKVGTDGSVEAMEILSYDKPMDAMPESNFSRYDQPQLSVKFKNGETLTEPSVRSSNLPPELTASDGTKTLLSSEPISSIQLRKMGLQSRYASGLINPCKIMLSNKVL